MKDEMKNLFKEAYLEKAPDQFTENFLKKFEEKKRLYRPILSMKVFVSILVIFTLLLIVLLSQIELSYNLPALNYSAYIQNYKTYFLLAFGFGSVKFFHGVYLLNRTSKY